jgi:hypothetical protein
MTKIAVHDPRGYGRYGGRGPGAPITDKGQAASPTISVDAWR